MTSLFLFLALIFPRLTLLINWLSENLPANDTPFWADFLMTLFFPRFLVAYWIWDMNQSAEIVSWVWFVLFILLGLTEGGGAASSNVRSKS